MASLVISAPCALWEVQAGGFWSRTWGAGAQTLQTTEEEIPAKSFC